MNRKRYVLKNRTRFFSFIFMVSLLVFVMVYTANVSGYKEPEYITVTVHSGDTLWSIAEDYCDNGQDIREYIHSIMTINHMDSSLLISESSIILPIE